MANAAFNVATNKTYMWSSYGHVALVRPLESYTGNDPDKQIRVKVISIKRKPKNDFGIKGGEDIPVFAEELTETK